MATLASTASTPAAKAAFLGRQLFLLLLSFNDFNYRGALMS
ncbi:hypothetical protein [Rufibacter glacialis]|nr:hypothetical protein [Rufibacter glacialis]